MRTPLLLLVFGSLALTACGGGGAPSVGTDTATSPAPQTGTQGAGDQTMSREEALILQQVNAARAEARLCGDVKFGATTPVSWNGYLGTAARAHAADMAARDFFAHVNPDGKRVRERAEAAGYTGWRELGENIAAGFAPEEVVEGWLSSTSHCKTLMDPSFRELGVGYTEATGKTYGNYWVQNFGTR